MPVRIQRRRTKGWRMPPNTVCCTRPSAFANPFGLRDGKCIHLATGVEITVNGLRYLAGPAKEPPRQFLAAAFHAWIDLPEKAELRDRIKRELAGKDLACWCPLDDFCHADVLLELANR